MAAATRCRIHLRANPMSMSGEARRIQDISGGGVHAQVDNGIQLERWALPQEMKPAKILLARVARWTEVIPTSAKCPTEPDLGHSVL